MWNLALIFGFYYNIYFGYLIIILFVILSFLFQLKLAQRHSHSVLYKLMQNCVSTDVGYRGRGLVRLKEGSIARERGGWYVKKGRTWKSPLRLANPMWNLFCIWRAQCGIFFNLRLEIPTWTRLCVWRFHVGFSKCKGDSTLESPNAK